MTLSDARPRNDSCFPRPRVVDEAQYPHEADGKGSLPREAGGTKCPELYFLKLESYIATVPTPLAGTQANQALALHLKERR